MSKIPVTFSLALETKQTSDLTEKNWKKTVLKSYNTEEDIEIQSDYPRQMVEMIVDEIDEPGIGVEIYENSKFPNLINCMTLRSVTCIEDCDDCFIYDFDVYFDLDHYKSIVGYHKP